MDTFKTLCKHPCLGPAEESLAEEISFTHLHKIPQEEIQPWVRSKWQCHAPEQRCDGQHFIHNLPPPLGVGLSQCGYYLSDNTQYTQTHIHTHSLSLSQDLASYSPKGLSAAHKISEQEIGHPRQQWKSAEKHNLPIKSSNATRDKCPGNACPCARKTHSHVFPTANVSIVSHPAPPLKKDHYIQF